MSAEAPEILYPFGGSERTKASVSQRVRKGDSCEFEPRKVGCGLRALSTVPIAPMLSSRRKDGLFIMCMNNDLSGEDTGHSLACMCVLSLITAAVPR